MLCDICNISFVCLFLIVTHFYFAIECVMKILGMCQTNNVVKKRKLLKNIHSCFIAYLCRQEIKHTEVFIF